MSFYLGRDDFYSRSILVSYLARIQALQPSHGLGEIEVEAAHVDKAAVYPTIRAWSLRERSLNI